MALSTFLEICDAKTFFGGVVAAFFRVLINMVSMKGGKMDESFGRENVHEIEKTIEQ